MAVFYVETWGSAFHSAALIQSVNGLFVASVFRVAELSRKIDAIQDGLQSGRTPASSGSPAVTSRECKAEAADFARGRMVPPPLPRDKSADSAAARVAGRPARYSSGDGMSRELGSLLYSDYKCLPTAV